MHRVVDGQAGAHDATGAADVQVDVPVGVLPLQEEELGDDDVGHLVVDRRVEKNNSLLEQKRIYVKSPLTPGAGLDDHGDNALRDEQSIVVRGVWHCVSLLFSVRDSPAIQKPPDWWVYSSFFLDPRISSIQPYSKASSAVR